MKIFFWCLKTHITCCENKTFRTRKAHNFHSFFSIKRINKCLWFYESSARYICRTCLSFPFEAMERHKVHNARWLWIRTHYFNSTTEINLVQGMLKKCGSAKKECYVENWCLHGMRSAMDLPHCLIKPSQLLNTFSTFLVFAFSRFTRYCLH